MKKYLVAAFMLVLMIPVSAMAISGPSLQGTVRSIKMSAKMRDGNGVVTTHAFTLTATANDANNAKIWVSDTATQGYMNFKAEITMAGSTAPGAVSGLDIIIGLPSVTMGLGSSSNTLIGQIPAAGTFTYHDLASVPHVINFQAACDVKAVATIDPVSGMPTRGTAVLKLSPANVVDTTDGSTLYLLIAIPTVAALPPAI